MLKFSRIWSWGDLVVEECSMDGRWKGWYCVKGGKKRKRECVDSVGGNGGGADTNTHQGFK